MLEKVRSPPARCGNDDEQDDHDRDDVRGQSPGTAGGRQRRRFRLIGSLGRALGHRQVAQNDSTHGRPSRLPPPENGERPAPFERRAQASIAINQLRPLRSRVSYRSPWSPYPERTFRLAPRVRSRGSIAMMLADATLKARAPIGN
jgi:hypothetical protein